MIIECGGRCGKKIVAEPDGKAYLCKPCWKALIQTLLHIVRPASEPRLTVVKPTIEADTQRVA